MATDGQSVSKSWCRAPSGAHDQIFITVWQLRSSFVGSFVYAADPCQHSLSRVRVPWDSRPYFTVLDLRLPFSSPPTTRRITVEVFDQVKVTLRLTVSQSVSLGVEPPPGAHDQIFIAVWQLQSCYCVAPSLTRGVFDPASTRVYGFSVILEPLVNLLNGPQRKHFSVSEVLCNLATSCSIAHRKHNSNCCVFAGTCLSSRCITLLLHAFVT
jgi:hypothetical protein